ncbi:hypothetical protein GCM10009789_56460 [Kribbella sancticallisti]|uniref:N-acetyltransferase domain-containing protein n=1 Tax=Kribbella sancticallisti TaxID=460087 RepID=A0ABN2E6M8_9ACTN
MEELLIRPATVDDLDVLHDIAERAVCELLNGSYEPAQLAAARAAKVHEVEREVIEAGRYYVIEVGGTVVGGSGWSDRGEFSPLEVSTGAVPVVDASTATMRATYVDPRWSRRGFATLLARVTETVATNAGFSTFEAMCTPASEALRVRLGYEVVERIATEFGDGVEVKVARMRKTL